MDKKAKLKVLVDQQKLAIEELRRSMEAFRDSSDLDEESTLDPEDFSQQSAAKEDQHRLEQQLKKAQIDLELIERYADEKFDAVQAGALIQTDKNWFLAGISLGGYMHGKDNVLCISIDSPAFEAVLGKQVNDSFILGNQTYHIKAIQ